MGRPSDRAFGVRLVTDYGALEWALAQKEKQETEKNQIVDKLNNIFSQDS